MNVIDAIKKRRSIRTFKNKKIKEEVLKKLIEAARLAPSGNNIQPWFYKIITKQEEKDLLKKNKIFKQDFVYDAPVLILCCADPDKYQSKKLEGLDNSNEMRAIRDLSISVQNLVLRATELGLGTCYVGWMDKTKIKEVFGLPKHYIAPYVIMVGYPAENPCEKKKKRIDEIIL